MILNHKKKKTQKLKLKTVPYRYIPNSITHKDKVKYSREIKKSREII